MKRSLTSREKNLITAAAAIVFCSLFTVYLILPLWNEYQLTRYRMELMQNEAGKAVTAQSGGNLDIKSAENELAGLRRQLPQSASTAEVVYELTRVAAKSGAVMGDFQFMKPDAKKQNQESDAAITSIYGSVRIIGNYAQIRNFVAGTENLTRLTYNKTVTIDEVRNLPGKLQATVEFDVFMAAGGKNKTEKDSDIPVVSTGRPTPFRY